MPPPSPERRAALADELRSSLAALHIGLRRWLADVAETCPDDGSGDPSFAEALRRWQEQLAHIRLHLHRADHRLLHLALTSGGGDPVVGGDAAVVPDWRERIERWFDRLRLPSAYRRLESVLDLDGEAATADITTDLAVLAVLAWDSAIRLRALLAEHDPDRLESLAFYGVLSPWRRRGLPALDQVQRWLGETLDDAGDW